MQPKHLCSGKPRFGGINPAERFFPLEEARTKLHREVRYAKATPYQNTGRVVGVDLVEADKWFAIVYWDATPDNYGKPGIRRYSKDSYEQFVAEDKEILSEE